MSSGDISWWQSCQVREKASSSASSDCFGAWFRWCWCSSRRFAPGICIDFLLSFLEYYFLCVSSTASLYFTLEDNGMLYLFQEIDSYIWGQYLCHLCKWLIFMEPKAICLKFIHSYVAKHMSIRVHLLPFDILIMFELSWSSRIKLM